MFMTEKLVFMFVIPCSFPKYDLDLVCIMKNLDKCFVTVTILFLLLFFSSSQ